MKITWGHGITVAIVLFMSFILLMVYKASQSDSDLVSADYYAKEIQFQDRINASGRAAQYSHEVVISSGKDAVEIMYPEGMSAANEGTVKFFRPNNADLDVLYPLTAKNGKQVIPRKRILPGTYTIEFEWTQDDLPYFIEKEIVIED